LNLFEKISLLGWYAGNSLKNGFKKVFNLSLSDPKAYDRSLWNLYGSQSLTGEVVTESTALTFSAVYNAISLISGTVGALPLHLYQQEKKSKHLALDEPLYRVMHYRWNPYMTAMTGRETMMAHILTYGNGYAEIVRDLMGRVQQLWPIPPDRVKIKMKEGKLIYEIRVDGEPIDLSREKVLHVPGLGFDGYQGYSVIAMARKSIGLGMAMETFGSRYFGEGTHPSGVVTHPGQLSNDNLRNALQEGYAGLGKTHRLLLLEESMKFEPITIKPEDSQFLQSRQFTIPEIARWFNLPPHKLKDLSKSSFNNIEQEQISFVTDSIMPWLIRLEQGYYQQLLIERQQESGLYFKHSVQGLLRGDSVSRADFYSKMFNIGAFSVNDIRELEDMNPIKGGDEHFVPMNMVPLSMAKEPPKKEETTPLLPAPEERKTELKKIIPIDPTIRVTGINKAEKSLK